MVEQLLKSVEGNLDTCQFAYKQYCSNYVVVVTLVPLILKHLINIAQALFLDFTSVFNTIQLELLLTKMIQIQVNPYLIRWYYSFLIGRSQIVKVNQTYSNSIVTYSGAPHGCVSSPFLFTLYTDDCKSVIVNILYVLKFSDDTESSKTALIM